MVRWSLPAKIDLREIYDYIARDSEFYAEKVTHDIVEKSEILNDFPLMGRIVPEIEDRNIREIFVYSYRIIYKISTKKIEILTVIHCKQDLLSKDF